MDEQHGIYVQPENKAETPEIHHTSTSAWQDTLLTQWLPVPAKLIAQSGLLQSKS